MQLHLHQHAAQGIRRPAAAGSRPVAAPVCVSRTSARRSLVVVASKLGDTPLFADPSTSSLLGGPVIEETKSKPKLDDVPLQSEVSAIGTTLAPEAQMMAENLIS